MRILVEPKLAMTKEKLKLASEVDPSSSLINLLSGNQDEETSPLLQASLVLALFAGVGLMVYKKCYM